MQGYSAVGAPSGASRQGSEYEDFLFAPMGTEQNGMLLSVLSVLARMNLDPWKEAAALAQLPRKTAAHKLAALIVSIPAGPSFSDEPGLLADRLVKLLPRQNLASLPADKQNPAIPSAMNVLLSIRGALRSKMAIYMVVLLIAVVLAVDWFGRSEAPAPTSPASSVMQSHSAR